MTTLNTVPNIGNVLARTLVITLSKAYDRELERIWDAYDRDLMRYHHAPSSTIAKVRSYYPELWADNEGSGLLTFNAFVRSLGFNPDALPVTDFERGCC